MATGYTFGPRGAVPVPDRDWIGGAGGAVYSAARDMARYVAALLGGGANDCGRVLRPDTLTAMMVPSYRTDPRLPMLGLSFFLTRVGEHRLVGHDGILPGFHATMLLAPDHGVGVVLLTNGSPGAMGWMPEEGGRLLRLLLGLANPPPTTDAPHRPELWPALCGRYALPEAVSDLRGRLAMGGGVEVLVRGGRLILRVRTPLPALLRGFPLEPDDPEDPLAFRLDLTAVGMGIIRVVFERDATGAAAAIHSDLGGQPVSFLRRPATGTRRRLVAAGGVAAIVAGLAAARRLSQGGGRG